MYSRKLGKLTLKSSIKKMTYAAASTKSYTSSLNIKTLNIKTKLSKCGMDCALHL